jgi:hypothetical protein
MTPAQFVHQRHPAAKRELSAIGYQIVANGETLGRSHLPNHAWECAARAVAQAEGNRSTDPWTAS